MRTDLTTTWSHLGDYLNEGKAGLLENRVFPERIWVGSWGVRVAVVAVGLVGGLVEVIGWMMVVEVVERVMMVEVIVLTELVAPVEVVELDELSEVTELAALAEVTALAALTELAELKE